MYRLLAKLYPGRLRGRYKALMRYCDIDANVERYIGVHIAFGLLIAFLISTIITIANTYPLPTFLTLFLILFVLLQFLDYAVLMLKADSKAHVVEEVLPDALLLMAMNIRSGMTTDRALIISARSEFGPLEKELTKAGKELLAGEEVRDALLGMAERIKSTLFERTIRLVIEGIESGGELSSLLQQTAEDIQNTKIVMHEVRSNLLMYAIFIFFAVGFGAPLLFAISTYLVGNVSAQFAAFSAAGSGQAALAALRVSPEFLVYFALIALAISSLFGGLIIGIIKSGTEKAGLKFIPMLLIVSYTVFFLVRTAVASIFPVVM